MAIAPVVAEVAATCAPFAPTASIAGQVFIATVVAATFTVNATGGSLYWSVSEPTQVSAVVGGVLSVMRKLCVAVPPLPAR